MAIINRFADLHEEITEWRRDFHAHPELLFDVHRTAAFVAEKLREFGVDEVVEGLGKTGVVGVIKGRRAGSGRVIGLRADMDGLPINEIGDKPYKSTAPGRMHACGHDGHTAMLLGAAKYLAETRDFDGTAIVIFQPAEEGGAGGQVMVDDGLIERFDIQEVFGLHNAPGIPEGQFAIRPGSLLASADFFTIDITGIGAHAAKPHCGIDPAIIVSQIIQSFQAIVSRNVDPIESLVISVTHIKMGDTNNVIPQTAFMEGTVRALKPDIRDLAEERMTQVCKHIGLLHNAEIDFKYIRLYPVTVNHELQTAFAASVARQVAGDARVDDDTPPIMGGEDFSFMLNACPGAFIFLGQGDTAGLHHPAYDFNDDIIPVGCSYWVKLVETAMPANK